MEVKNRRIELYKTREGRIKVKTDSEEIPVDIVEEMMNQVEAITIERISDSKADDFVAKAAELKVKMQTRLWQFIAITSLIVMFITIARVEGWI